MSARYPLLATFALGCPTPDPVSLDAASSPTAPSPGDTADTAAAPTTPTDPWPAPGRSACADPASKVQLAVTVPAGAEGTGALVVGMMHRRYGQPALGGHPHWVWRFEDQPLSATTPTYLTIDMCDGNAVMWSEENCEYNLIVLVDGNGNNGLTAGQMARPDPGEPAAMIVYEQSCTHDGAYRFEVALDCLDGEACIAYEAEPDCTCAETSCDSESAICLL